ERPMRACELVHLVERRVADPRGELALELPVAVQNLAEPVVVAALERGRDAARELLDPIQLGAAVAGPGLLLREDHVRLTRAPGEEEVQARIEIAQLLGAERDPLDVDAFVAPEPEAPEPAVGGERPV